MKIRVLAVYPAAQVVVQYYRGEGVMPYLRRLDRDVEVVTPTHPDVWRDLVRVDVLYIMRSTDPGHVKAAKMAKAMGVPVWYDLDDNLFELSPDNPAYGGYEDEVLARLTEMLTLADKVTCSTEDLADQLADRFKGTPFRIIPNALDTYAFHGLGTMPKAGPRKFITWRGGASHLADLMHHTPAFHKFDDMADPSWGVQFVGFNPSWLTDPPPWLKQPKHPMPRYYFTPYTFDFYRYVRAFRESLAPWAHVVPLRDTLFNRAKSAISAIEAIYAGALPIVPNWTEWQIPGALKYADTDQLADAMLEAAAMDPATRDDRWAQCVQWVKEQRTLDLVNLQRLALLQELTGAR